MCDEENTIEYLELQKRLFPDSLNVLSGHFDTAIKALREKLKRKKGCRFCNAKNYRWDDNYCPKCGRKLGENDG